MTTFFTGKVGENLQLVPPSKRRRLIYEKLHSKMGHLVSETVYQLANKRVFRPKMKEDVIQFVTRVWSYFKKKPPHMLKIGKEKTVCKDHINKLIFVHNCTNHSSTGYSRYHLLFGYKPPFLMDLTLDRSQKVDHLTSYDQYLSKWGEAMRQGYSMSTSKSKERKAKNKNRSDENIRMCMLRTTSHM